MALQEAWQTVVNTAAIALTAQGAYMIADAVPSNDWKGVVFIALGAALEFAKYWLVQYWQHKPQTPESSTP